MKTTLLPRRRFTLAALASLFAGRARASVVPKGPRTVADVLDAGDHEAIFETVRAVGNWPSGGGGRVYHKGAEWTAYSSVYGDWYQVSFEPREDYVPLASQILVPAPALTPGAAQ